MSDLPAGYRWANAEETEVWETLPGAIVVSRTVDSNGTPYTQGEADIAVPISPVYLEGYEDAKTLIAELDDVPLVRLAVPPAMPEEYRSGFLCACDDVAEERGEA